MNDQWIVQPNLWALAMDRAARDLPKWTKAFWRKVSELYQRMGGTTLEGDDELPEDT